MKKLYEIYMDIRKNNYFFRTMLSSAVSSVIGCAFIIFNGVLGMVYRSLWHGTICIYYIILTTIRGMIVLGQRKEEHRDEMAGISYRLKVSRYTHFLLLILNLSLIVPIAIMVKGERAYDYGLIPAIAMAAYTTYRIAVSCFHMKKVKKESNCLVRELRVINMIDAMVAILSLQNMMIIATEGEVKQGMNDMTAFTSAVIFGVIVFITIRSMIINSK